MHIKLGPKNTKVTLGGQRPIPNQVAQEMTKTGERLFHTYQAIDQSSIDTNPEEGKVEFRTPGRFGANVSNAEFSGDIYTGKLAINQDQRGEFLNRYYEFNRENGNNEVVVTDYLPTFHKQEMNIYRIQGGHRGTVEHVIVD